MTERNGDGTRARIVAAALDLFSQYGFERTTVRMIADQCGITDAALYYHFPSKRALFNALWVEDFTYLEFSSPPPTLTPHRLDAMVEATLNGMRSTYRLIRLLTQSTLTGDKTAESFSRASNAVWRENVRARFRTVFDDEEAATHADAYIALMRGHNWKQLILQGDCFPEHAGRPEYVEQLQHLVRMTVPIPTT